MKDVIIVGGGLKGMLTALFLHDAGLNVMIMDQNELGRESSWAGGGLVSPLYPWRCKPEVTRLVGYSQQHYPALCARLLDETGINPQWLPSGLLITDMDEQSDAIHWAETNGHVLTLLKDRADVQACEPQLGANFDQALFFPDIGQVRSPRLSAALRVSLRQRPILISEHQPVRQLHVEDGQVKGVYLGNDLFSAHKVVITSGAWTSCFTQIQETGLPIRPKLAHSIMFRTQRGLLSRMLVKQGHYLIPRQDGRIVCGPILEGSGLEKHVNEDASRTLQQLASELMPALAGLPIHNQWSSLLSVTQDDIPFVGEHPQVRGLFINAGHGTHGMATGLASVQLLVDQVLAQESFIPATGYALPSVRP